MKGTVCPPLLRPFYGALVFASVGCHLVLSACTKTTSFSWFAYNSRSQRHELLMTPRALSRWKPRGIFAQADSWWSIQPLIAAATSPMPRTPTCSGRTLQLLLISTHGYMWNAPTTAIPIGKRPRDCSRSRLMLSVVGRVKYNHLLWGAEERL